MKLVELYGRMRFSARIEGISRREAARRFGIYPDSPGTRKSCLRISPKAIPVVP